MAAKAKKARRNFSSFTLPEALQELQLSELLRWEIQPQPFQASAFLDERLRRLERNFDLAFSESAKELLIDAYCEEVIDRHPRLKIWKSASLQSDELTGLVDYLVAPKMAYVTKPLLCVVEAKKDDFEKGLAQCLVEMKACRLNNEQAGYHLDIYGIVSNGGVWQFYQLTVAGQVFETLPHSLSNMEQMLGVLNYVFTKCEENLPAQFKLAQAS